MRQGLCVGSMRQTGLVLLASCFLKVQSRLTHKLARLTFLQMQRGSLYPPLHCLERRGWIVPIRTMFGFPTGPT